MDKKLKIIIVCVVLMILMIVLINKFRKNRKTTETDNKIMTSSSYNENEGVYKVVDEKTGEILYEGNSEVEAYLYQIDPTYESTNPDSVDEFEILESE